MEKFRTQFEIPKNSTKIDFESKIVSLGSCFSENIGAKLVYYKYQALINPFGIIYNPESIANSIELLLKPKPFSEADLFEHDSIWNSFFHHSRFSNKNKEDALSKMNSSLQAASTQLKKANFLLITFGTSWVYEYLETKQIVSNCHKIPSKHFKRYKLSIEYIVERYSTLINELIKFNPALNIIFTVSPARHLKDGAAQNQLSKATLIMAVHELIQNFENANYFPSYEIMMDDLRDYRFYNDDMVHPSPLAINYIWDRFCDFVLDEKSKKLMFDIEKINQAIEHRSFQPNSIAHQKFLKSTLVKIETIEKQNPNIDFSYEKETLLSRIIRL